MPLEPEVVDIGSVSVSVAAVQHAVNSPPRILKISKGSWQRLGACDLIGTRCRKCFLCGGPKQGQNAHNWQPRIIPKIRVS